MNYLQSLYGPSKTCVLINNNLSGKFNSSLELPVTFDKRLKVTSVPFSIPDFNFVVN